MTYKIGTFYYDMEHDYKLLYLGVGTNEYNSLQQHVFMVYESHINRPITSMIRTYPLTENKKLMEYDKFKLYSRVA